MKDLDTRNDSAAIRDEELEIVAGGREENIRLCPVCGRTEASPIGDGTCDNCRSKAGHVPPPYITN